MFLKGLKKESSPNKRSKRVKEDEESSPDEDENEERIYGMYLLYTCVKFN